MGLRQDLYESVYDALTSAYLLSSTATVTAAYIDSDTARFPQVVVNPVDVELENFTYDRTHSTKRIRIIVDIWTKKNKDKDIIADQISEISTSSLVGSTGCMLVGWTESNALEPQGGNKIHLKSISLDFLKG